MGHFQIDAFRELNSNRDKQKCVAFLALRPEKMPKLVSKGVTSREEAKNCWDWECYIFACGEAPGLQGGTLKLVL